MGICTLSEVATDGNLIHFWFSRLLMAICGQDMKGVLFVSCICMVKLSSKLTMWPGENGKAIAQTKTGDIAISIGVLVLSDTCDMVREEDSRTRKRNGHCNNRCEEEYWCDKKKSVPSLEFITLRVEVHGVVWTPDGRMRRRTMSSVSERDRADQD